LEGIQEWYADEGVPEIGDRFVGEIFERVGILAENPEIGRIAPEFDRPHLRELIHPPFRTFSPAAAVTKNPVACSTVRSDCPFDQASAV